jgi:hypothetical protein
MAVSERPQAPSPPQSAKPIAPTQRPSPAWVLGLFGAGLLLVFLGERVLLTTPPARWTASALGLAALAASVAMRWVKVGRLTGDARGIERAMATLSTVGLVSVLVYFASADPLSSKLGFASLAPDTRKRVDGVLTCLWIGGVLLTALPMLFGQLALEPMRLSERVEWRRVRSALGTGAALAMACGYATLFVFAAGGLAWRADFSYLRTARPSEATVKVAAGLAEPLRVIEFFPPVNEVEVEVDRYMRDLSAKTAGNVHVEQADRLQTPTLAKDMNVTQDGTVVLVRGAGKETLTFPIVLADARAKLKTLDADFHRALLKVLRERRTAYLTVGHGELNDTHEHEESGRSGSAMKQLLERLNFTVRTLGVAEGLATQVPKDATVVVVAGPSDPLAQQEVDTLHKYLDGGGHVLIAVDPDAKGGQEPLAAAAGLTFHADVLCDDRNHAARRMNESDNGIIFTNRFSSHPSVATLSRLGSRALFFIDAGWLEAAAGASPDFIVRSLTTTFADKHKNFKLDEPDEKRAAWNLAAAVSKKLGDAKDKAALEMRAVVLADADVLSDAAMMNPSVANGNPQFFADVMKWLGGDEANIGVMPDTGEDVRIEHTKQTDTALFYSTIFGAPAIVLGFGLVFTRRSRRRRKA